MHQRVLETTRPENGQRLRLGKVRLTMCDLDLVDLTRRAAAAFREGNVNVIAAAPMAVRGDAVRLREVINTVLGTLASGNGDSAITLRIGCGPWPGCQPQPTLDLDLLVARELVRLHGGGLWAEEGSSIVVLPLKFSPLSHAILAASASSLATK